jgi:hypothetical protein
MEGVVHVNGISRRIFLSTALLAGWSPVLAKTPAKNLPNCVQGGATNGWNWSARLIGILFGRDAAGPDEIAIILGLTTVSPMSPAAGQQKDVPVFIHHLPNSIMQGITSVSAFWDDQPAPTIQISDGTVTHEGADPSLGFDQALFEPVNNVKQLPHAGATTLSYELKAADGSLRRFSMPLTGLSDAFRQAGAMRVKLGKNHKAGLCLGPEDCFLTTATCTLFGLADDCFELRAARRLRDEYLCSRPGGTRLIDDYYRHAPSLAEELWASRRGKQTLVWIYWSAILPCALMVRCGAYGLAERRYRSMFTRLQRAQTAGSAFRM